MKYMHFIAVLIGRETKNKRARYIVSVVLEEVFADEGCDYVPKNRRFPEITGKDNLTVFSYSGRVKSPEWRQAAEKSRSATVLDLQAWTYYNLC